MATPQKAFGGHLEPGNPVFTFAVITLGVNDTITLTLKNIALASLHASDFIVSPHH